MGNEFSPEAVSDLDRLRQRAASLQEMMRGIQDSAPQRTESTDRTGAVRVAVGSDGLPESIRVETRWRERIRPEALGAAVAEAAQQAIRRRGEAWGRTLERSGQPADPGPYAAAPEPEGAAGPPAPRSLGDIAEEVIGMLGTSMSSPARPSYGQGVSPDRAVAITVARDGQLSCVVDARWAAERSGGQLDQALGQALAAAREELRGQAARDSASAGRIGQISAEIRAAVSEETQQSARRGRRE